MTTISLDILTKALMNSLGKKGMDATEVSKLAEYVLDFFGFDDAIIDNMLKAKDRDVFYMLEEEGFLSTFQDTIVIKKGKTWRIHYWVLKKDQIIKLSQDVKEPEQEKVGKYDFYSDIPEDVWNRE